MNNTSDQQRCKVLLFLHGIRNDDPTGLWRAALDAALSREGEPSLSERGYRIVAPSYLAILDSETVPATDAPHMTYVKGDEEGYRRAAGAYWTTLAQLERTGVRGHVRPASVLRAVPADEVVNALVGTLFRDAQAYCESSDRRHLIYRRILKDLPPEADLTIIAHSLGSVVAADLLYHLPRDSRLRMLITLGSPLALKPLARHLTRKRNRFPFELAAPWINVAGTGDPITGYRGLSETIPEALDVFIDTGSIPKPAHASTAYLDDAAVAKCLVWLDARHDRAPRSDPNGSSLPDLLVPEALISVIAGAQYALRLEQAQESGDRRTRFGQARRLVLDSLVDRLRDAGFEHSVLSRLNLDNAAVLNGRIGHEQAVNVLLTAWMSNPLMPYEIELSDEVRRSALERLASDLGLPTKWAAAVMSAEKQARGVHSKGWTWKRTALIAAGAAAIVAAPMLVLAAAPAGLAGGAAIVGGLAALGPGGMLGGVGIVSLVGGAGGAVAAQALVSGSSAQVEETVIHLQAMARAGRDLGQERAGVQPWSALIAMEDALTDEKARQAMFSDGDTAAVKEVKTKLDSVRRALDWLDEQHLGPRRLEAPPA